ncbi:helix-turn-helix transcriptional regulator [Clostridium sp.]|uniref:helix-turn-helix domain-containing protein n=1 Tax=Clostridium sp. TaxID=1506 RepID=UPI002FC62674
MEKNSNIKSFGELIRDLRKQREVSLYDVERETGISASYINRIERENRENPSMEYVSRLSRYFGIPITIIQDLFPGAYKGEANDCVSLDKLILKNEVYFANIKATIDVKLSLQKIVWILEDNIASEQTTRTMEANLLQEVDRLRIKVNKSA